MPLCAAGCLSSSQAWLFYGPTPSHRGTKRGTFLTGNRQLFPGYLGAVRQLAIASCNPYPYALRPLAAASPCHEIQSGHDLGAGACETCMHLLCKFAFMSIWLQGFLICQAC